MVFEPDVLLAEVVVDEAAKRSIEVVLLTTQAKSCTSPWVYVHPRASESDEAALTLGQVNFICIG